MENILLAVILAAALVWVLRAMGAARSTHRKARELMRKYRDGTDSERAAMEREADAGTA